MGDNFKSNFGTILQIGTGSTAPYSYADIKGVYLVPPIQSSQEKIEVTHHDQDSHYRKYIPSGLIDPGDYEFEMRADRSHATQQAIYSLYTSGALGHFAIKHPDGLTKYFDAYVIGMTYNEADATSPAPVNITVALAISGGISEEEESL